MKYKLILEFEDSEEVGVQWPFDFVYRYLGAHKPIIYADKVTLVSPVWTYTLKDRADGLQTIEPTEEEL